jgi:hypothetical protein
MRAIYMEKRSLNPLVPSLIDGEEYEISPSKRDDHVCVKGHEIATDGRKCFYWIGNFIICSDIDEMEIHKQEQLA